MNNVTTKTTAEDLRPRFSLYHPNGKCTGCALEMDLSPAHGNHDGYIMLRLAPQKTLGAMRGAEKIFPTFDWENRICVKLGFSDICKILQVLRGETESLEGGKGLYHKSTRYTTRIVLRHLLEPIQGYSLEVYRDMPGHPDKNKMAHIVLNTWEAMGIGMSFENSIGLICFGIPKTWAQDRKDETDGGETYEIPA